MKPATLAEIASLLDHSFLMPVHTDNDLVECCKQALRFKTASVCIKPYGVKLASELLKGSMVKTGTVIGFPHGNSSIISKAAECNDAILNGAEEIDMVVNIGKVIQEDWQYINDEITAVLNETKSHGKILKVIFETGYLQDSHKITLCKICSTLVVDYVKTSTGFCYIKKPDGKTITYGATLRDINLMRENSKPQVKIKASGGIRSLNDVLAFAEAGADRIGTSATLKIMGEAVELGYC